uniref:DUF5727 domain-containing protein n=1 Tax=Echinococcus granulosus TaxID=6210 RepID=A0A068X5C0_ECHGR|nr:hypothetical protein EgrG_002061900 [Echinococcus granulosus]
MPRKATILANRINGQWGSASEYDCLLEADGHRAQPGFEPGTSRTQSENHTPRPLSLVGPHPFLGFLNTLPYRLALQHHLTSTTVLLHLAVNSKQSTLTNPCRLLHTGDLNDQHQYVSANRTSVWGSWVAVSSRKTISLASPSGEVACLQSGSWVYAAPVGQVGCPGGPMDKLLVSGAEECSFVLIFVENTANNKVRISYSDSLMDASFFDWPQVKPHTGRRMHRTVNEK